MIFYYFIHTVSSFTNTQSTQPIMNSSYSVQITTFCENTSVYMEFSYEDMVFLEFEVDNTLTVEDWEFFTERLRDTDKKTYFLTLQKDDEARVKLVSSGNFFEINVGVNKYSNGSVRVRLVKNESLFKAFENSVLNLKSIDDMKFSDDESEESEE